MEMAQSALEKARMKDIPTLPLFLRGGGVHFSPLAETKSIGDERTIQALFSHLYGRPIMRARLGNLISHPLRVGVVFSGGQAPGGHNVIAGLFGALKIIHPQSVLIGFVGGPSGIIENNTKDISEEIISYYLNSGGFDLIGSGRTKIETDEQLKASLESVRKLKLDGVVIIGGDDSNTNAAVLAEFFLSNQCETRVIGIPKTIDGDLKSEHIEASFGFDTACKIYAELIGNIARDALSAKKYTHFIKLMGRSASHIALECALQVHPNMTLIGEEIAAKKMTLDVLSGGIADLIEKRAESGKNYGVILIPEGLIEFLPDMKQLFKELNQLLSMEESSAVLDKLSPEAKKTFSLLPPLIKEQLLLDRDPHGNVQVSHIETEKLLIHGVKERLKNRKQAIKFNPVSHFFGYEGRSAFPSFFDAHYCYALGHLAAFLIQAKLTGYMAVLRGLKESPNQWEGEAIPLTMLMNVEERKGKRKPVIQKALVNLEGKPFRFFSSLRDKWSLGDHYQFPGPLQLFGPDAVVEQVTVTLQLEQGEQVVSV